MITLFIDTSTDSLNIGLIKNDDLLSSITLPSSEHSKYAMAAIEKLFSDNNIDSKNVDKIMVVNGPGSFTGIRIGVTIAKIYAWALKIKVIPISTLKAYAISNTGYKYYVCMIDARRDCYYASIYDSNYNDILEQRYIEKKDLIKEIDKLDNYLIISNSSFDNYSYEKPTLNIKNIYEYYKNEEGINCHMLNPVYLKKTEAEEKLGE